MSNTDDNYHLQNFYLTPLEPEAISKREVLRSRLGFNLTVTDLYRFSMGR